MINYRKYISTNTRICHGQACFKGTRILVYIVLELLQEGETPKAIIKNAYPQLTLAHIQAALRYAAEAIKTGEFIPFIHTR